METLDFQEVWFCFFFYNYQLCFTTHLLANLQQMARDAGSTTQHRSLDSYISNPFTKTQRIRIEPHGKESVQPERIFDFFIFSSFSLCAPKSYLEKASLKISCNILILFNSQGLEKIWTQEGGSVPVTNPNFNARSSPQAAELYFLKLILKCRITPNSEPD